jgi:hypothetical protein
MKTEVMDVSPALAKAWLTLNTNNRQPSHYRIKAYAEDMRKGDWKLTHQGIAISVDNIISDGQHRLMAIVESGVTVKMLVTTQMPKESIVAIDQGFSRTVVNALHMSIDESSWVTTKVASAVHWFYDFKGGRVSANQLYDAAKSARESLVFATDNMKTYRQGITKAPVMAAIALLHHSGKDVPTLVDFCDKLLSGIVCGESESSIIRIREWLLANTNQSSSPHNLTLMNRVQRAYILFSEKTPCKMLKSSIDMPAPRMPRPVFK